MGRITITSSISYFKSDRKQADKISRKLVNEGWKRIKTYKEYLFREEQKYVRV